MLTVFVMLGELLRDFGLSQAAIQTAHLSRGQASNLFWSNVLVGLLMTAALFLAAPAVAVLYHEPELRSVAPWVGLTFTVNALQSQFQVQLARAHRFLALTITDVSAQLVGLSAGLFAACAGAAYWSLVVQMLSAYGALLLQRALISGFWPNLPRREPGMVSLYTFGLHSGMAQLVQYVASNVDTYIIGVRYGAAPLGVYNRAFQMFSVPANQILAPLTNVALPVLSKRRHEGGDFYPLLWRAQIVISSAFTLVFALAASLSEPMVRIALGSEWTQSAPILAILSIGGAAQVLSYMAFWAFLASANTQQLFYHSLVTKPLLAACILMGSLSGIRGVAWGFSIGLLVSWFISLAWLRRCDCMPVGRFLSSGMHVLLSGLLAGGLGWWVINKLNSSVNVVLLAGGGGAGVIGVYTLSLLLIKTTRAELRESYRPAYTYLKAAMIRRRLSSVD